MSCPSSVVYQIKYAVDRIESLIEKDLSREKIINELKAELEARNKLLRQAVPWVEWYKLRIDGFDYRVKEIKEWIKEVQERVKCPR